MERKDFIKTSLFLTGAILLPNAIWSFGKDSNVAPKNSNKFISKPNLKRFKVSDTRTKFFETELSILKPKTILKLHRKFFISENINGICTPTLLETNQIESLVFISELYKDKKHNGFIVKVCENGLCEETKIFTHENQGYYAFWGKEYLGNPTLYHYNIDTFHLMRMHQENGQWINHRVMPIYPDEMIALYKQQLQQVEQEKLTQQFGFDFEIHKDGFYQFLSLKNDWEERIITKEKEIYENNNPAKIFTFKNEVKPVIEKEVPFDYTNPFIPIYCTGDDLSYATIKPTVLYEELPSTKIEIPNMPSIGTQDDLGECRAFSMGTIIQKKVCDRFPAENSDCSRPAPEYNVSKFGMLIYTNRKPGQSKTFEPDQNESRSMYEIINDFTEGGSRVILDSCKPFDQVVNTLGTTDSAGQTKKVKLFTYLKKLYADKRSVTEADIADCPECLSEIKKSSGLNINMQNLKSALLKENYDKFLYSLFFDECKLKNLFLSVKMSAYPDDSIDASAADLKNKVIEGLKKGNPVLYPAVCAFPQNGDECESVHSVVISGYKKVCTKDSKPVCKDVFKIHNSWGVEWQRMNNDGWVDADAFTQNTSKDNKGDKYRYPSASVIWLE